ncbi:hypothetical protein X474_06230 [Dethiosulfatarculus sandiegensis]|uniref:Uncharacterized protein n=1 Tax=Dethiosulfatarculus sandiegensis TaxID=1429043 RepID=A0A0D2JYU8_9BACT|nr:hypothetical protein X474_06230 [Dethiosulfatarculus sandiegensis]
MLLCEEDGKKAPLHLQAGMIRLHRLTQTVKPQADIFKISTPTALTAVLRADRAWMIRESVFFIQTCNR